MVALHRSTGQGSAAPAVDQPLLSGQVRRDLGADQSPDGVNDSLGDIGSLLPRLPDDNQTVRNVFVIGPDKKIKPILVDPMTTGHNFDEMLRVIESLQLTANHRVATPRELEAGQ